MGQSHVNCLDPSCGGLVQPTYETLLEENTQRHAPHSLATWP
jgi:hypothetical protein